MSQPSNAATSLSQILEDVEQISNDIFVEKTEQISNDVYVEKNTTNSIEKQISEQMNKTDSWISSSLKSLERQPPLRPLTAYNIYFQLQRERIMNDDESSTVKFTEQDVMVVIEDRYNNWAGTNIRERSKDYEKNSKKYTFGEFATKIAAKWKAADEETKALMRKYSKKQREEYYKLNYASDEAMNRPVRLDCDKVPPVKPPRKTPVKPPRKISSASEFGSLQNPVQLDCDKAPPPSSRQTDTTDSDFNFLRNPVAASASSLDNNLDNVRITSRSKSLIKNGNIMNFDEEIDWDRDLLAISNQQPNMVEMEQQRLQSSKRRASANGDFGIQQQYPIPSQPPTGYTMAQPSCSSFSMEKYNCYMLWKKRIHYQRRQENMMAYKKAQMEYYHNLRQLRNAYSKLKMMSTMQYNHVVFPDHPNSTADDADYYMPFDGDDEYEEDEDIDTNVDDKFLQQPPVAMAERSLYSDCRNDITSRVTHVTDVTGEGNYAAALYNTLEDDNNNNNNASLLQMKPRPSVSMNSFDNINENIFEHDDHDDNDDDFSVM